MLLIHSNCKLLTIQLDIFTLLQHMIRKKDVRLILFFILLPFFSSPYLVIQSIKNNKLAQICLCLFLGMISMIMVPPQGDLYRHAEVFYQIKELQSFRELFLFLTLNIKFDFLLYLFEFIIARLSFQFGIIQFSLISIAYGLFFHLYNIECKQNALSKQRKIYLFLIIIFSVPFIKISIGLRYAFACVLMVYFIIKREVLCEKKIYDWFLLLIAICFHFAVSPICAMIALNPILPCFKKSLFILLIITLFCISSLSSYLILSLPIPEDMVSHVQEYTANGKYADDSYLPARNFFGMLPDLIHAAIVYLYIYLIIRNIPITSQTKIMFYLILIFAFTAPLYSVNFRVSMIINIIGALFIYKYKKRMYKCIIILFLFQAFVSTLLPWRTWPTMHLQYLLAPFPLALMVDYDESWIEKNINNEGGFYVYQ